jgi:hypothetical protein
MSPWRDLRVPKDVDAVARLLVLIVERQLAGVATRVQLALQHAIKVAVSIYNVHFELAIVVVIEKADLAGWNTRIKEGLRLGEA